VTDNNNPYGNISPPQSFTPNPFSAQSSSNQGNYQNNDTKNIDTFVSQRSNDNKNINCEVNNLNLRSARFRKGREESWKKLEELLGRMEKKGLRSLSAEENVELPRLYQITLSSLAVARNMILDRHLLMYLESLTFRAYIAVYGPRETLPELFGKFIKKDFPKAVRSLRYHVLISFIILLTGFLSGFFMVKMDMNNFHNLVPVELAPVNPSDSKEWIIQNEIHSQWLGYEETFILFAEFLFKHNSKVAIFAFSTSFMIGIPTISIIFTNGQTIGAMVSLHDEKDLLFQYLAWLSIHGITELLAFVLASAAGLSIAHRIVMPGNKKRLTALAIYGKQAGMVMIGVIFMLFIAAILEGGFRQLISNTPGRAIIALSTALFWFRYFVFQGKDKEREN
jgi:uncharacterized membrane protein SpoIIM required for sporulation